ncbi:MAG: hypothetical protein BWX80_03115 [Candidatus Hydrogenedentes bacterium ADurb.Bin101]|nr:MAG: hypothetical protein BWX80_03115 [Candidatus Hydrogenedentes bacterium ADurb.Bin101]
MVITDPPLSKLCKLTSTDAVPPFLSTVTISAASSPSPVFTSALYSGSVGFGGVSLLSLLPLSSLSPLPLRVKVAVTVTAFAGTVNVVLAEAALLKLPPLPVIHLSN